MSCALDPDVGVKAIAPFESRLKLPYCPKPPEVALSWVISPLNVWPLVGVTEIFAIVAPFEAPMRNWIVPELNPERPVPGRPVL